MIIFVTGTNTDVGKTVATATIAVALAQSGYKVVYAKPLQTGEANDSGDAATVRALAGVEVMEMARFPEPLAPNLSARRAGMIPPTREELRGWVTGLDTPDRVVLVEGAGGLLVRLADDYTLADVATNLLIVTSLGLGSLNAAELTVREAQRRGINVMGLIGGSVPAEPDLATRLNVDELPVVTGCRLWGSVPEGAGALGRGEFARMARAQFPAEVCAELLAHAD
ncbi:dethiobiotin synthase [Corynebacterium macginleyi]|uniref:dethiobiotin synthase n=3 Tax=Corynebacterium macginleyi TaxID=38290 RepID=UPI00190C1BD3|nr:dethiobiotin synthase [Corynebacterium macginleyi]MBK4179035.1 ATP-dependent dethiobiotin synthetase BioD [Corynebacterium macginleyi]